MIKVQIKDKTYETSDAVNVVLNRGWKVFKFARAVKSLAATLFEWAVILTLVGAAGFGSAYIHESDLLSACGEGKEMSLLHSDFKLNQNCAIVHSE